MSKPLFVVLRRDGPALETIGPVAAGFDEFEAADRYARAMLKRYEQHRFAVCQAVAVYEVEQVTSVTSLVENSRLMDAKAGGSENVVGMPARQAGQRSTR